MMLNGRPGDLRGFVHKRIFGGIKGFVSSGFNPLGALSGFVSGGGSNQERNLLAAQRAQARAQQRALAVTPTAQPVPFRPPPISVAAPTVPRGAAGCPPGFTRSGNECVETFGGQVKVKGLEGVVQRALPFGETGFEDFGQAVVGRFGAGLQPAVMAIETRRCPRGAVLAVDGLCYNKRDISNKERFWPRGRRPLLTGGEMRCISIASRAANKLQRKQKQLQDLGMLKKPSTRRMKALPSGHHAHVAHDGA